MKIKDFYMGDHFCDHRVELEIEYDIDPGEPMTHDSPGYGAYCEFEIKSARVYYREGHIKKFRQMGDGFIGRIERDKDMMESITDACWDDAKGRKADAKIDAYESRFNDLLAMD